MSTKISTVLYYGALKKFWFISKSWKATSVKGPQTVEVSIFVFHGYAVRSLQYLGDFLCACRTIATATFKFVRSGCPHGKTPLQQDEFSWNFTLRNYKTSVGQIPVRCNWTTVTYFTLRPKFSYKKYIWPLNEAYLAPCRFDFMPCNMIN